jgi:trigger factor
MKLVAIAIDRKPLLAFTFEQGHLLLTLRVYDDESQQVLWIEQNELRYSTSPWDIQLVGCRPSIRERARKFLIDLVFGPPIRIDVRRGRFRLNELLVQPDLLCYANNCQIFKRVEFHGFDVAIMVGDPFESGIARCIYMPAVNRGEPVREEAERWMREIASDI